MDIISLLIILLFHRFYSLAIEEEGCKTKTESGGFLGKSMVSRDRRQFCAFLGVPYAAAPVGNLRFLPPELPQPWEGTKNFTQESVECVQKEVGGSEDCLYLNIFTHSTKETAVNAVMMYIHGGGFRIGSSSLDVVGPEYLMDKDIVLVTFQYRLGPFGFLSTEDEVIPGNMGLKDQVRALQWIQDNIKYFGGDPEKVTLFGNSAGGASVHFHMQSSVSRELFIRGISQSGTAFSGFAIASKGINRNITYNIASKLNCSNVDSREILSCMQNRTALDIMRAHDDIKKLRYNKILLRPVVEVDSEHAFLSLHTQKPETDKPWMVGVTANEGIVFISQLTLNSILHLVNSNFSKIGPELMFLEDNYTSLNKVLDEIYDFYFRNNSSRDDRIKSVEQLISDSWFVWPTEKAIANYNETFYYYLYDHLGEHSNVEYYNCPRGFGVAHTDELLALFSTKFYPPLNKQDTNISKLMVDLWVNFAMKGNPTPQPVSRNPQKPHEYTFIWEESNNTDTKYLHIQTNTLEMKRGLFSHRMKLWDKLKSNVRDDK